VNIAGSTRSQIATASKRNIRYLLDVTLREILHKLRPLLEPPLQPPKPEIGFHVKEDAVRYRVRKKN
jgi:hypothetical protein